MYTAPIGVISPYWQKTSGTPTGPPYITACANCTRMKEIWPSRLPCYIMSCSTSSAFPLHLPPTLNKCKHHLLYPTLTRGLATSGKHTTRFDHASQKSCRRNQGCGKTRKKKRQLDTYAPPQLPCHLQICQYSTLQSS